MSWFFKAGLTGLAVICLFVVAGVTAFAKYPYDNGHHYGQLSNPGHHYGQLKHHLSPPPATHPTPAPHSNGGGSTPLVVTGHMQGGGATGGGTSAVSGLPTAPSPVGGTSDNVSFTQPTTPARGLEWLILLLVPALAALWVISGARTAQRASRRWGGKPA